jgi:hypothetical protein
MTMSFKGLLGDTPDREQLRKAVTLLPSAPAVPPDHPDYETQLLAAAEHWFTPDDPHLDALVALHSTGRNALTGRDYLLPSDRGALYATPAGREGFFLLTGIPAAGKTTLALALERTFGRPIDLGPLSIPGAIHPINFVPVVRVRVKGMSEAQILRSLIETLHNAAGKPKSVRLPNASASLDLLRTYLAAAIVRHGVCLLIIDEAQGTRLGTRLWSAIDALSALPCVLAVVTNYDPVVTWLADAVSARRVGRLGRHDLRGFLLNGTVYANHIESLLAIAPYGVKPGDRESLLDSIKHHCWGVPEATNRLAISLMVHSGRIGQPISRQTLDDVVKLQGVKEDLRIATAIREGHTSRLRNLDSPFPDLAAKYQVTPLYRSVLLAAWRRTQPEVKDVEPRVAKRTAPENAPSGSEQRFLRRANARRLGL